MGFLNSHGEELYLTIESCMGLPRKVVYSDGKTVCGTVCQQNRTHMGLKDNSGAIIMVRKDSIVSLEPV